MAVTTDTIRSDYPLPAYNYRVEINGESVAFTEVSGLNIAYEVSTYKESPTTSGAAGPRTLYMPSQPTMTSLTLRKGIVRNASLRTLYGWIKTVQLNQVEKKDIFIRLCDEKGEAVISWKVINAFPIRLDAPTFDAKSNDAAIETMELKADGVTLEES
ncbi:MAG TPA: phage tail protein [Myxococcota bacterium]|nr:phage tail protein [Myxococcota bacterium]